MSKDLDPLLLGRSQVDPEQREQTLQVAREFVSEANKLLGDKDREIRTDPHDRNICLTGKKYIETVATAFRDADILADYYEFMRGGNLVYSTQHLYAFYPDRVVHHINNSTSKTEWVPITNYNQPSTFGYMESRQIEIQREPSIKLEATAEELTGLLNAVKNSKPWESN